MIKRLMCFVGWHHWRHVDSDLVPHIGCRHCDEINLNPSKRIQKKIDRVGLKHRLLDAVQTQRARIAELEHELKTGRAVMAAANNRYYAGDHKAHCAGRGLSGQCTCGQLEITEALDAHDKAMKEVT